MSFLLKGPPVSCLVSGKDGTLPKLPGTDGQNPISQQLERMKPDWNMTSQLLPGVAWMLAI